MIKNILVVGGTGLLGLPVAKQLKEDGYDVDILTTNSENALKKCGAGFKYVNGDVREASNLADILNRYQGIHINLNSNSYKELRDVEVNGCMNIANTAKQSDVKKITMISGLGVSSANSGIPFVKAKLDVEKAIKESGVSYTIFNCTHFMESIPLYIRNGKAMIMGAQTHKIHWLSVTDYANMVSKSYEIRESDNKNYSLIGPEAYTMKEVFEKYVSRVDANIKITKVSLNLLGIIATLTFNPKLKYLVDLMRYFDQTPEKYDPDKLPEILGTAETNLDFWLSQGKLS